MKKLLLLTLLLPFAGKAQDTTKLKMLISENGIVRSIEGYQVTEQVGVTEIFIPSHYRTKHIAWLDERKKPLPKNAIVWMSK